MCDSVEDGDEQVTSTADVARFLPTVLGSVNQMRSSRLRQLLVCSPPDPAIPEDTQGCSMDSKYWVSRLIWL
jgi:hypothetical protein